MNLVHSIDFSIILIHLGLPNVLFLSDFFLIKILYAIFSVCATCPNHITTLKLIIVVKLTGDRGGKVVKVLCYKSEGRWFDPSWCHWNFSLT